MCLDVLYTCGCEVVNCGLDYASDNAEHYALLHLVYRFASANYLSDSLHIGIREGKVYRWHKERIIYDSLQRSRYLIVVVGTNVAIRISCHNIEVIYAYVFTKISKISRIDKFTFSSSNFSSSNQAKIGRKIARKSI